MNSPFQEIASMVQQQAKTQANQAMAGLTLELGTITPTGLRLDSFKHEIQDCYYADFPAKAHVPQHAVLGQSLGPVDEEGEPLPGATVSPLTKFTFQAMKVAGARYELKAGLLPGDRVLCAPINGGHDVIVLCKVVK